MQMQGLNTLANEEQEGGNDNPRNDDNEEKGKHEKRKLQTEARVCLVRKLHRDPFSLLRCGKCMLRQSMVRVPTSRAITRKRPSANVCM